MNETVISIKQNNDSTFNISLEGNMNDILIGLAVATTQAIGGAPEHYRQELIAKYLCYLSQATVEYYKGESL